MVLIILLQPFIPSAPEFKKIEVSVQSEQSVFYNLDKIFQKLTEYWQAERHSLRNLQQPDH